MGKMKESKAYLDEVAYAAAVENITLFGELQTALERLAEAERGLDAARVDNNQFEQANEFLNERINEMHGRLAEAEALLLAIRQNFHMTAEWADRIDARLNKDLVK